MEYSGVTIIKQTIKQKKSKLPTILPLSSYLNIIKLMIHF